MSHSWPAETVFRQLTLDVDDRSCPHCGQSMHVCTHRDRRLLTLEGPLQLKLRLFHCPIEGCQGHTKTFSSDAELGVTMPWWLIGWDVFAWIGHRRLSRHWSVPQIRAELQDRFAIHLSEDAIEDYIHRYQIMLAARQQENCKVRFVILGPAVAVRGWGARRGGLRERGGACRASSGYSARSGPRC